MSFLGYLKGGVVGLLVGMMLAGAGVWWAKDQQVKAVRVELQAARDANEANQQTIASQKEEIHKANESCTARISNKDKTITRLQEIDGLVPGGASDEKKGVVGSGDPILAELNGMWNRSDIND